MGWNYNYETFLKVLTNYSWTTINCPFKNLTFNNHFSDCVVMGYKFNGTYTNSRYHDSKSQPIVYSLFEKDSQLCLSYKYIFFAQKQTFVIKEVVPCADDDRASIAYFTDLNPNYFEVKMLLESSNLNGEKFLNAFYGTAK